MRDHELLGEPLRDAEPHLGGARGEGEDDESGGGVEKIYVANQPLLRVDIRVDKER